MMRDHHPPPGRSSLDSELTLLTAKEVAALLKVKVSWLYTEVQAGRFPVVRLGRQLRFRRDDVLAYIGEHFERSSEADFAARMRRSRLNHRRGHPRTG